MIAKIIILMIMAAGFALECSRHGEPKKGEHNAGSHFVAMIIGLTLYYFAGLFEGII